jgi:hypothetical protein
MKIISETGVQTKLDMYVLLASIIVIDFLFLFSDGIFHFILGQSVVYKLLVYIPLIKDHFHCTSHTLTRRVPFLTCVNNIKIPGKSNLKLIQDLLFFWQQSCHLLGF